MVKEILIPLHIEKRHYLTDIEIPLYSVYFPRGYVPKESVTEDMEFLNVLKGYRTHIKRAHIPPEKSIKNMESTIEFLQYFNFMLQESGLFGNMEIDIHPGRKISLAEIKNQVKNMDEIINDYNMPILVSVENVKKTSVSSVDEIAALARYIKNNGIKNVKLTVDVIHFKKAGRSHMDKFDRLLEILKSESLADLISCVHTDYKSAGEIETKYGNLLDNSQMVIEGSIWNI